ncbi:MAG: uL15 family ribosomal protein [Candidatus Diapherotrites archaeon]|nr:uL15 family ribosomal protein [Candidatus Diapherotrites archaeon]
MVVRKKRRVNRLRGQRTHGAGDTKNRRGGGCRGGRGKGGSHKHKFSKYYMFFGTERKQILPQRTVAAINIGQLQERLPALLAEGKAEKEGGGFVVDGHKVGFDKILSMGSVRERLVLRNIAASKKAREKIIAAGGIVEGTKQEEEAKKPEKRETETATKSAEKIGTESGAKTGGKKEAPAGGAKPKESK